MINSYLEELAAGFWRQAGEGARFPRDPIRAVLLSDRFQINIVRMEKLRTSAVRQWLHANAWPLPMECCERHLNGCLWAYAGRQTIFIEATLASSEQRMVAAHEVGHILADYEAPRGRICKRLGNGLAPVLDGKREATATERMGAALAGVDLGAHLHFMDRTLEGTYSAAVNEVERRANELALELIAPWRTVVGVVKAHGQSEDDRRQLCERLQSYFGLPPGWADPYARTLQRYLRGRRPFSETLGL